MSTHDDAELKRLRWRCRRGMRELDVLFNAYLDRAWPTASDAERGVFLQLMDCEDDRLWRWFMGYEDVPDASLRGLVERMRSLQEQR
ncbi:MULTISPECIES: succinate dehydrogenase assembly factor 2 [unclassified Luteimonas]|uniref:FAD assembly factor SdhE n=1 Tax=Lysobacteraceae TaxID=32033 RepID=UPI00100B4597|nr:MULTISPECIES: succinate dehydrogenase assembly factor 2 [unclassified Luteimonas]MCD9046041.1 succinate dehydrogenase assembly factor 2 [Luteimonas sp. MHLX1A]